MHITYICVGDMILPTKTIGMIHFISVTEIGKIFDVGDGYTRRNVLVTAFGDGFSTFKKQQHNVKFR